jgi:hypothetical protein
LIGENSTKNNETDNYRLYIYGTPMKKLIIGIFCILTSVAKAQVVTNAEVLTAYNNAFKKLPLNYQQGVNNMANQPFAIGGFAIYTFYKIDTLNKNEAIDYSNIYIADVNRNRKPIDITNVKEENTYMPIPFGAVMKADTLIMGPYTELQHKIIKNLAITTYQEYRKRDAIFRLNLKQFKTNKLNIPVKTTRFTLSSLNLKPGTIIYGEIEYETADYFVGDPGFTSKHIHKRLHCKYVFKTTITDLGTIK